MESGPHPAVEPRVRVVVADDSAEFLRAAVAVVSAAEFEVAGVARSGEDAVATAAALAPDLVLLDVNMPGLGGVEAASQIKAAHPETVVVLITAVTGYDLPARAHACGAEEALHKRDLLPRKLAELWRRHRRL